MTNGNLTITDNNANTLHDCDILDNEQGERFQVRQTEGKWVLVSEWNAMEWPIEDAEQMQLVRGCVEEYSS